MKAEMKAIWQFAEIKYLRLRLRHVQWESRVVRSTHPLRWLVLYYLHPPFILHHLRVAYLTVNIFFLRQSLKRRTGNHVE